MWSTVVLKGITNTDLLGALGKLQGVSGTQLQETVASLADEEIRRARQSLNQLVVNKSNNAP